MEIRALDFLPLPPLPDSEVNVVSGIRAMAFAVVGGSVLRAPLICGNWKWVLEGCVCVSPSPVGMEVSSYRTKPFNGRGTLVFAHRASALWWSGCGILGAGSVGL